MVPGVRRLWWLFFLLLYLPAAYGDPQPVQKETQVCTWKDTRISLTITGTPKIQEQSVRIELTDLAGRPIPTAGRKAQLRLWMGTRAWISLWPKEPNYLTGGGKFAYDKDLVVELRLENFPDKPPSLFFKPFLPQAQPEPCSLTPPVSPGFKRAVLLEMGPDPMAQSHSIQRDDGTTMTIPAILPDSKDYFFVVQVGDQILVGKSDTQTVEAHRLYWQHGDFVEVKFQTQTRLGRQVNKTFLVNLYGIFGTYIIQFTRFDLFKKVTVTYGAGYLQIGEL